MIFGIKTRKDLKKEIEKLNKQLEEYRGSESIRKVNIVRTTRPLARLQACCIVPTAFYGALPEDKYVDIAETLESEISKGLINYMDIEVLDDPFNLKKQITGTLTVVVPEKGGYIYDSNSKIDISRWK